MTSSQLLPADDLLDQMAENLKEYIASHNIENPAMVGIHSGGAWLAEVLHKTLNIESPLGLININFYRDDFTQRGLQPQVNGSDLPFDIDNRHLI
jgi:pyrimidine operon attenuation protein/uracil phosphoribosyltransferase